jgi:hypothetical protein
VFAGCGFPALVSRGKMSREAPENSHILRKKPWEI